MNIFARDVTDSDTIGLVDGLVRSFNVGVEGKGLPLGNLTSQLLVNIYMNEFDQFAKHQLKAKCYIRYADDFVFLSCDKKYLELLILRIKNFLESELALRLHPKKLHIKTVASGVDFLGWVHFSDHCVLRTTAKRKMFRTIVEKNGKEETVQSYLGLLSHGNAEKLQTEVGGMFEEGEEK